MTPGTPGPGQPCWLSLAVSHVEAAGAFYAALFGWTYEGKGDARRALVAGEHAAGIQANGSAEAVPADAPTDFASSGWTVWLASHDLAADVARATELGATVLDASREVHPRVRSAIVRDPQGATFGLWPATVDAGFGVAHRPGAYDWCDLFSPDGPAAQRFYAELFGASLQPLGDAGARDVAADAMFVVGGAPAAALFERRDRAQAAWLPFLEVGDADAATEACEAAGGRVIKGPHDTPYGRLAVLTDPWGARFGINRVAKEP